MQANPNWWGKLDGNVTEVIYTPIKADATRVAALLVGRRRPGHRPADAGRRAAAAMTRSSRCSTGTRVRTIFIGLDQCSDELQYSSVKGKNPFKDVRVRKALNLAVDREAIKRVTMRGLSIPAAIMIAPGVHGYANDIDKVAPVDGEGAKKLLAEAGYPNGLRVRPRLPEQPLRQRRGDLPGAGRRCGRASA